MKKRSIFVILIIPVLVIGLVACGGDDEEPEPTAPPEAPAATPTPAPPQGDAAAGEKIFAQTCIACHGPAGEGVPNLGKDMTASEFIAGKSDQELVDFIKVGRDPSDPLNTTNVAMPPKGGNPALSDDDLMDVVAFIRKLQK